jgi:hypothetical protein
MRLRVVLVIAVAVLTGCGGRVNLEEPWIAGVATTYKARHEALRSVLTQSQLEALSRWFGQHLSGWQGMITEAPMRSAIYSLDLELKRADGKMASIGLDERADGSYYMVVSTSEKWSYVSSGRLFKSWAGSREVSTQQAAELRRMVGAEDHVPSDVTGTIKGSASGRPPLL